MPRIVLVYPLPDAEVEERLRASAEVVVPASDGHDDVAAAVRDSHAVILRGPARLTGEMIAAAPHLRVVGAQGSGTDNIDVPAATARGIPVVHGAGIAPVPVAEWVIGAMVAGHRQFARLDRLLRGASVQWEARLGNYRGTQLTGTTLGVVGYGHIGREVARMARAAFAVDVIVHDPYLPDGADLTGVRRVADLPDLLVASDTVTVHAPLLDSTRSLIDRDGLRQIGPDGVLVDAARGGVVDERGLVEALAAGELKAAVLDVFDPEPPTPGQLAALASVPGLIMTPHVAGVTGRGLRDLSANVVDGVLAVLAGQRPARVVNPEVFGPVTRG